MFITSRWTSGVAAPRLAEGAVAPDRNQQLPSWVFLLGALSHRFFCGVSGSPTKIDYRKKLVALFLALYRRT